uniref:Hexosyltransferase n=1 Tax=Rhizophora mucronata TaxID=61149 RepID=A0A2P2L7R1_RHIMU
MKGGIGGTFQGKRRWRCLATGVLFLVVLSMLVPLRFLYGLYKGFHSAGYLSDGPSTTTSVPMHSSNLVHNIDFINKLQQTLPKDSRGDFQNDSEGKEIDRGTPEEFEQKKDIPVPPEAVLQPVLSRNYTGAGPKTGVNKSMKSRVEGVERLCELKFGSYCLWREEHREKMKDYMVKKLKDQLFVARAYYPSIAKLPAQNDLTRELKQNIQEFERVLSENTMDTDLSPGIEMKLQKMEAVIARAKSFPVDCNNVDKKLRQIYDMTDEEAGFHMKRSSFLYQVAVQTMPKSLHCLSMKLTMEYFLSSLKDMELSMSEKYLDPTLQHYVIFSNNVLASSVVVNSTVAHARDSGNLVFHVLTDHQNYFATRQWFLRNTYDKATVEVLNLENLNLKIQDKAALLSISLPVEFRVSFYGVDGPSATNYKTEYVSVFSRAHFLLPYILHNLNRVVVLDDDVVVQKDLSNLWTLDMGGKVNGAVQLCSVQLSQLNVLMAGKRYSRSSCAWMSGINVIDLAQWRELALTETYWKLEKEVSEILKRICYVLLCLE